MKKHKPSRHIIRTLGLSIIAAAWLIGGPDILSATGWHSKIIDLLVWVPAMTVMFIVISADKQFIACERRAFMRLIGK